MVGKITGEPPGVYIVQLEFSQQTFVLLLFLLEFTSRRPQRLERVLLLL